MASPGTAERSTCTRFRLRSWLPADAESGPLVAGGAHQSRAVGMTHRETGSFEVLVMRKIQLSSTALRLRLPVLSYTKRRQANVCRRRHHLQADSSKPKDTVANVNTSINSASGRGNHRSRDRMRVDGPPRRAVATAVTHGGRLADLLLVDGRDAGHRGELADLGIPHAARAVAASDAWVANWSNDGGDG